MKYFILAFALLANPFMNFSFANDESMIISPENWEENFDNETKQPGDDDESLTRTPYGDGCSIQFVVSGRNFFSSSNDSKKFCQNFGNIFTTQNNCFVRQIGNRWESNYRYGRLFSSTGNSWASARQSVYNQFFSYLNNINFHNHRFGGGFYFPRNCS